MTPIVPSPPEIAVLSRLLFVVMLVAGATGTSAAISECQAGCEKNYKYCTTNGKSSANTCKMEYEKCRKQCVKKDGTPSPS
jgi:hypothetical protein